MKIKLLLYLFFAIICNLTLNANTSVRTEVLEDESSSMPLSSIIKSVDFKKLESNSISRAFSNSTYWLRITPKTTFTRNHKIVFSNSFNHFESIFLVYSPDSIVSSSFGTDQPNDSETFLPSFNLSKKIKEIYVSIKSNTFIYESFKISSIKEANRSNNNYLLFQALFLGFVLFLSGYTLLLYLKTKRPIVGRYFNYLVSVLFMTLFLSNFGNYFFWPNLPFSPSYLEITFCFFMVWSYMKLIMQVVKLDQNKPTTHKVSNYFLYVCLLLIFFSALFFHPKHLSLLANIIPSIAILFLIYFIAIGIRSKNYTAKIYLFGIISFILGSSSRILINWGVIEYSLFSDSLAYIGLFIELILFTYVVVIHIEENIKSTSSIKDDLMKSKKIISELQSNDSNKVPNESHELDLPELINKNLHDKLTTREIEVLQELISGGTQKEISEKLFISVNTLKTHIGRVYSKLDSKNRVEAINKARELMNQSI